MRRLMSNFLETVGKLYDRVEPLGRVLEVGCGEGDLATHLTGRRRPEAFIGLDVSAKIIELARRRYPELEFVTQSAKELPFESKSFDLVIACEVLEHVDDPGKVLSEIARVSRKHVILSVPREPIWRALNMARGAYLHAWGNTPGHVQHWSKRGFTRFVESGLRVVEVRSPLPWTVIAAERR